MHDRPPLAPIKLLRRTVCVVCITLLLTPIALYAVLLFLEAYSARQASAALTQLESLKVGDPASSYDSAVSAFKSEAGVHVLTAGAFRLERLWDWMWTFSPYCADRLFYFASKAGLRWWRLTTSATTEDGKMSRVSVGFMVVGRYEMLGTGWDLSAEQPSMYGRVPIRGLDRRTFMNWFHITSMPGGEGFRIAVTPQSTAKELAARRINRRCLLSFRGCDDLCGLLPSVHPVLRDLGTDWQGYTDVPPSRCNPD
jgi:hypothetical protein